MIIIFSRIYVKLKDMGTFALKFYLLFICFLNAKFNDFINSLQ